MKIINNSQLFTIKFDQPVPLHSTIEQFKELDIVEYAHEPITIIYHDEPNDPLFRDDNHNVQWYFEAIQAVDAWGITHGSSNVVIGIIDNGFNPDHPDLTAKVLSHDGTNGNWHGTKVASVAGAVTNNGIGISSLGWNSILRFYSCGYGIGLDTNITLLVDKIYVATRYCDIINMSWGTAKVATIEDLADGCEKYSGYLMPYSYLEVQNEINNATQQGVILISSAGNESPNPYIKPYGCDPYTIPYPDYPSQYPGVISVSGTKINESFNEVFNTDWNYGDFVDVSAPGVNIIVASGDDEYITRSGTSYSAPMVAALASLIIALDPYENAENIIKSTADKIDSYPYVNGWNNRLGYGRINAYKALKACFPAKPINLRLTGTVGSHPVLLWSANTEPDLNGYRIYRQVVGIEPEYCIATVSKNYTTYTDQGIQIDGHFDPLVKYRIAAYDLANNESEKSDYVSTYSGGINKPIAEQSAKPLPTASAVHPAFPNPFNLNLTIKYEIPGESLIKIQVYNLQGKLIWESNKELLSAGYYEFCWRQSYLPANILSSGVYTFVFHINQQSFIQKAVYVK